MKKVIYQDLGRISYKDAWDYQQVKLKEVIDRKLANRNLAETEQTEQQHYLLFCEHNPVYTLGRNGDFSNLLLNEKGLAEHGIEFFKINRGGDITYHGLGQIVGYPIFDMDCFFTDVHKYVRFLEEVIIRTIAEYGLDGIRIEGSTGVWLAGDDTRPPRKICAIGIHLSRWVTMHGFAFNVNTDLAHFDFIIPCGITDKAVTSLHLEVGRKVDYEEVKTKVKKHFQELFMFEYTENL
jgi:lipoyl(octanoyl) transferase